MSVLRNDYRMILLMLSFFLVFILLDIPAFAITPLKQYQITMYTQMFEPVIHNKNGKVYIAIRSYYIDKKHYWIVVDPNTLKTYQKETSSFSYFSNVTNTKTKQDVITKFHNSGYIKMLKTYNAPPYKIQRYGLKHAKVDKNGVFLTIDLCPSNKPFEKEFFEYLITMAKINKQPQPIFIAISGLWLLKHLGEFQWLAKQKTLEITWVNHSFSHPYSVNLPLNQNFLLSSGVNIKDEILKLEKILLQNGITPSVFFRFPGLVANANLIHIVNKFGLIPLSTDAWLAKGERTTSGSVVLIHGNSNERSGIQAMTRILEISKPTLLSIKGLCVW